MAIFVMTMRVGSYIRPRCGRDSNTVLLHAAATTVVARGARAARRTQLGSNGLARRPLLCHGGRSVRALKRRGRRSKPVLSQLAAARRRQGCDCVLAGLSMGREHKQWYNHAWEQASASVDPSRWCTWLVTHTPARLSSRRWLALRCVRTPGTLRPMRRRSWISCWSLPCPSA